MRTPTSALLIALRNFPARALAADLLGLALAGGILALFSPTPSPTGEVPVEPVLWSLAFSAAVVAVAAGRGDFRAPLRPDLAEVLRQAATTTALASIVVITARVVLADDSYVAAETIRHWAAVLPILVALRGAVLWREGRARSHGARLAPTLIVGAGNVGQRIAERLLGEPEIGLKPVAFLDSGDNPQSRLPVRLFDEDLEALVREYGIRHVVIAFAWGGDATMPGLVRRLWALGVSVNVVPRLFELGGERTVLGFLGAMPVAMMQPVEHHGWRMRTKYGLDRAVAAVGLVVLAPLLALIACMVLVTLGRPIFFRQLRCGNDGRRFWMLKFRTMREGRGGEVEADAAWAGMMLGTPVSGEAPGVDDRTTSLSRFLRRTSADELPQLCNVLRGEMTLVGPRPERVAYAEAFGQTIHGYADRHRVKSGLTGWAQVSGLRGKTSLHDRVEWDNHYIEHWSPWLDLKILLLTVPRLIRRPGV
jgi:exopolysaccharide biosynthesis polyprenyl glycosylphosphotransferase